MSETDARFKIPDFFDDVPMEDNFAAPEAGSYAPRIWPRKVVPFRFEMTPVLDKTTKQPRPGGIGSVMVQNKEYPQIQYTAHVLLKQVPADALIEATDAEEHRIPFNTASTFVTKRGISGVGELNRTLGLNEKFGGPPPTVKESLTRLLGANGAVGYAEIGWWAYDAASGVTFTTHPNPKKTSEKPWPISNGRPTLTVSFGDREVYGREQVVSLRLPPNNPKT